MDGDLVELGVSEGGGSCGVWVERDAGPVIELEGVSGAKADEHE